MIDIHANDSGSLDVFFMGKMNDVIKTRSIKDKYRYDPVFKVVNDKKKQKREQ